MSSNSQQQEAVAIWKIELTSSSTEPAVMDFVRIPACPNGFMMGNRGIQASAEPIHRVVISEDFWISETPVTQSQFDCWPGAKQRGEDYFNAGQPHHPAENLNWYDAQAYCQWLTDRYSEKFPAGYGFASLPCEAQWEYACRGDASGLRPPTDYCTGDGEAALYEAGWFNSNADNQTHAVRCKLANAFGLYDMHGNVWEWCLDRWDSEAYRRRWDGITERETLRLAASFGEKDYRVQRGGSIGYSADWCRSAIRYRFWAGFRHWDFGFRVCLVRSPLPAE